MGQTVEEYVKGEAYRLCGGLRVLSDEVLELVENEDYVKASVKMQLFGKQYEKVFQLLNSIGRFPKEEREKDFDVALEEAKEIMSRSLLQAREQIDRMEEKMNEEDEDED